MRRALAPVALLFLLAPPAAADILLVGGRPVRCSWWEDGDTVVVNPYNSTNRAMTFGVERHPRSRVNLAKVRSTESPEEEYCRRSFEIRSGTAEDHAALAKWCEEKKLPDFASRERERVLECDAANEDARKALGPAGLKEVLRRSGKANQALGELLGQYLAADNAATRRVLYERMKREHDVSLPASYLERAWRGSRRPRGRTDDVPLTFRSDKVKGPEGVKYTMFVPASYDPLRPTPLLVGLHGGGRGGKKGDKVVGSGPSAMNFYTGVAEDHGWLCVCPTAIEAPWGQEINGEFFEAVLLEIPLLYNVDLNRVYLTGHSMGGYGTWYWGPRWAERWAAVAPMAGGGGPGLPRLKNTLTPIYVYHGADDNVVGVDGDRAAAQSLLDSGHDFVYTELNGVGHGCPPGSPEGLPALERALGDENDGVFHAALGAVLAVGDRKAGPALLRALDAQAKRFGEKFMGTTMDYSDFDPRCAALGAAALAAAALAEPKDAVARIRDRVVRPVLEAGYHVQALARAGEFPDQVRARLAKQVAEALAKTAAPEAKDVLLHLKEACRKEGAIVDACDDALRTLDGGGLPAPETGSGNGNG